MAVPVEAPERRESAGHGGAHAAGRFHGATEDLQVRTPDFQETDDVAGAPLGEESKIGGVTDEGVADVSGQEPGDRAAVGEAEWILHSDEFDGVDSCGHGGLLGDPHPFGSGSRHRPDPHPHVTGRYRAFGLECLAAAPVTEIR